MSENSAAIFMHSEIRNLREGIRRIYDTKELSDVTFKKNGNGDEEDHEFKAHKLVLAARSPEFQRILLGGIVPDPVFIENESITKTGFDILLRFIYTDEVGTEEKLPIIEAFIAANHYQQRALEAACLGKIKHWKITLNEVWQLLNAGLVIPMLKDKCLEFIRNNATVAIASPSFENISFECISTVLDSGVLKSVPIMDCLARIMDWAAKYYAVTNEDFSPVREAFERSGLLSKLRIERLNKEEFPLFVTSYEGLITDKEIKQFMKYMVKKEKTLPDWCIPLVEEE